MPLTSGSRLGPYEVVSPLRAGGMGEVYRARDTRLDREVAIKVLPAESSTDPDRLKRFAQESKAAGALSHPNLLAVFDTGVHEGGPYIVFELLQGETLRERLGPGPLPTRKAVEYAVQIAHGLAAAHEAGIIHRDLKPENVFVTKDGRIKLLDFGLAKLRPTRDLDDLSTEAATESEITGAGVVLGTVGYMSPEQVEGKAADNRSDIFSFGSVLYEMLSGRRAFRRDSGIETMRAILKEDPAGLTDPNGSVPPALDRVVSRCLEKRPEERFQSARDIAFALEALSGVDAGPGVAGLRASRWAIMTAVAIATLAGTAWLLRLPLPPRITDIRPLGLDVGPEFRTQGQPTWTTDGVRLYYVVLEEGRWRIRQVPVSGGESAEVPTPFRSGIEIYGFLRKQSALLVLVDDGEASDSPVWLVPVPQGAPRRMGDLRAISMALSPDEEHLLLARRNRIVLARVDGSEARPLLDIPAIGPGWIRWAPDGKRFRFTGRGPVGHESESYVWESSTAAETPRPLWPGGRGEWTADGRYFIFDQTDQLARRSEVAAVRESHWLPWARPQPVRLTAGPVSFRHVGARPDGRGLLAFGRAAKGELHRYETRSRRFERFLDGQSIGMVRPSPDGQRLAWVSYPEGVLWRGRRDGRDRLPLTNPPLQAFMPSWSPDGAKIAFVGGDSTNDQGLSLRLVSANGGSVEVLAKPEKGSEYWDPCFLPDGRTLLFSAHVSPPGIHRLDLETRTVSPMEGAEQLLYPKCGPQGQVLASRLVVGGQSFMVYWPQHAAWEDLGLGPRSLDYPTWTRDGQSFCGLAREANRIECYSFASRRLETRAEIGDMPLLTWTFVPWMGLDADDSPMVMRDRSTRDIYSLDWEAP